VDELELNEYNELSDRCKNLEDLLDRIAEELRYFASIRCDDYAGLVYDIEAILKEKTG